MTSRVKEEERIEKIIRGLLKLQENRRCINCNSLGPQYVCTTFLTFVCTTCSGVHREFTHRVKSISMAKFNAEEVSALQAGGNERAREIYFRSWDPQRHSYPECSNLHRIREFIRHVYVDRKYTGERGMDQLPRLKMEKQDSNKKVDMYERRYGEQSSFNGSNEDKSLKYYYDERRSPRFAQQNNRYGGYKRSPVRFEVVDDRFRDDGFGSGRRSDSSRFSNVEPVPGCSSPEFRKNVDVTKSIVVRPVSDILGENAPPLKVGEPQTSINRKDGRGSAPNLSPNATRVQQGQKEHPASNWAAFRSLEKKKADQPPKENTLEALFSLLVDPPPAPTRDSQELLRSKTSPSAALVGNILPLAVDGGSLAAQGHDMSAIPQDVGPSANSSSSNLLTPNESSVVDASNTDPPSNFAIPPTDGTAASTSTPGPSSNFPVEPTSRSSLFAASRTNEGAYAATSERSMSLPNTGDDDTQLSSGHGQIIQQHQPSACSAMNICSAAEPMPPSVGTSDDNSWALSLISNSDEPTTVFAEQSSELNSKPGSDTSSQGGKQSTEVKPCRRKELPIDLFTSSYSAVPAPVPHWQSIQHHAMGFGGQYYHPASLHRPNFPKPTISTNPFDLSSGITQAPMFPSMAPMHEALSSVSLHAGSYDTSNMGNQQPQLMRPHSPSYASELPSGSPSYASSFYMEQQGPSNMSPSGLHGFGSFGTGGADYTTSFTTNQPPPGGYNEGVSSPHSFPSRGVNPFV